MQKWLGAAAAAAMVAAGGLASGAALADDLNLKGGAACSPAGTSLAITPQDHQVDHERPPAPARQAVPPPSGDQGRSPGGGSDAEDGVRRRGPEGGYG